MSYLAPLTSETELGVVQVGNYITVTNGVISLNQDLSPTADVTFNTVEANELFDNGDRVVTSVTPTADVGISVLSLVSDGPATSFTIKNTGVLSLTAGAGISISGGTGDITISSYGADLINVYGTTTNYTATLTDEYIGVSSISNITITLPTAVDGRVYIIKDEYGQGSGKITIQPQVGEKIDNKINYVISTPYQSVQVVYRNSNWWIM
jgi:hypothetical protein